MGKGGVEGVAAEFGPTGGRRRKRRRRSGFNQKLDKKYTIA